MLCRLIVAFVRWLKRLFPPDAAPAHGGGPALDRALGELAPSEFDDWWDQLNIEAAERGLTGPDRDRWIERQINTLPSRANAGRRNPRQATN